MAVWVWVAQGPVMQSTAVPANWQLNGMTPPTPPPNDGSVNVQVNPGTAPMQFTPGLTVIDSISVPPGWGKTIQLDNGLEIRGLMMPLSVIFNTTFNILGAPLVIGVPAIVHLFDVTTETIAAQVQVIKIDGKVEVLGKINGNEVKAKGIIEITPTGTLNVTGNNDGSATYIAELGMSVHANPASAGRVTVKGVAGNRGYLDVYTLLLNGGILWTQELGTVEVTGTLPTNDPNFSGASMIAQSSGPTRDAQVRLTGKSPSLTTEYGLYIAAPRGNVLAINPHDGTIATLNGDVYTYGRVWVSAENGGGSIGTTGNVTLHNADFDHVFSGAANSPVLWTCDTFTGAGAPTGTGATVSATITNMPANSITYKLVATTNGANSTSGKFTKGTINGAAYPATWALAPGNNGQELNLTYTKP